MASSEISRLRSPGCYTSAVKMSDNSLPEALTIQHRGISLATCVENYYSVFLSE